MRLRLEVRWACDPLIHDCGGVDYESRRQTITEDVPGLLAKLKPILGDEP